MDKRNLLIAFVLMMIVAVAPSLIWPSKKPVGRPDGRTADSGQVAAKTADSSVAAAAPAVRPPGRPTVAQTDTGRTSGSHRHSTDSASALAEVVSFPPNYCTTSHLLRAIL